MPVQPAPPLLAAVGIAVYNAPLCVGAARRFSGGEDMKKTKTPAKKAKPIAKPKKAAVKSSGSLLSKLKGAIARKKPAAATKPSAKAPGTSAAKPSKTAKKAVPSPKNVTASKKPTVATKPAAKPAPAPAKTSTTKAPAKPAAASSAAPKAAAAPVKKAAAVAVPKPARRPLPADGSINEDYIRSMKDADYMNEVQFEFFRSRLLQMRDEVLQREVDVKERLHEREIFADPADRATAEEEHWLDLRLRERESLLLKKIDDALRRIESKEYGYCEKTGDPIGIPRLLARPTATVCVDIKGQDERVEAQFRDR